MSYNHFANIKELSEVARIDPNEMFDYREHDPYGVVENYFQFCQADLSESSTKYKIQPARIFIRKDMSVNGAAAKVGRYYVIRINFGTILTVFRLYTDHRDIFERESLHTFSALNQGLDVSLDYLMFQVSTQFTFYHEKAHLIQLSPGAWIEETYHTTSPKNEPYDLKRHVYEFDADLHASSFVTFHLLQYWKKQTEQLRTDTHLELLISLGVASIFSYFVFLMRNYTEIYYKASTHPHPLIRISYILDNIIKAAENNLGKKGMIDPKRTISTAFTIADLLFSKGGNAWVNNFAKLFLEQVENIEDYTNNVLWKEANLMPELAIHRD